MNWSKIRTWLNNTDEGTWVGHWLQGLAGFWLAYLPFVWLLGLPKAAAISAGILAGFLVVALVFAHREGDNLLDGLRKYGARLFAKNKALDGINDWVMPVLGTFVDIGLILGGFWGFAGGLFGSACWWGISALYVRNTRKGK